MTTDVERLEQTLRILNVTREQLDHVKVCADGCFIDTGGDDWGTEPGFEPGCGPELHKVYPDRYAEDGTYIGPAPSGKTVGNVLGQMVWPPERYLASDVFPKVPVTKKTASYFTFKRA